MKTRPATVHDAASIAQLLAELRAGPVDPNNLQAQLAMLLAGPHGTVMLAEDDGGVVGMAAINLVYKLPKVEARIDEVVVAARARGRGYAVQLMQACHQWAWQHGADVIELTSRPARVAANRLYQRLGYRLRPTNVYLYERDV